MFLSAQALAIEYGIDDRIAKFFVDREPPENNLYWKDKLLYLRPLPGYIFIPLIVDLYKRCGIPEDDLLSEKYVATLESILHLAAMEEMGEITQVELRMRCSQLISNRTQNENFISLINDYLEGRSSVLNTISVPFESLKRGDVFLYSLCVLNINQDTFIQLCRLWFALISTLLLMDDSEDYNQDLASGDENVFIESGSSKEGFEAIKQMLAKNLSIIEAVNYSVAHALHEKVIPIPGKPGIKEYLNA